MLRSLQTLVLAMIAALAIASSATAFAPKTALRAHHDFSPARVGALATQQREAHQQNTLGYGDVASDASLAARAGVLAARYGTTAERTALLGRAIASDGTLNTSATVARQLANERGYIPVQAIVETVGSGVRTADPQGVAGQFMYRSAVSFLKSGGETSTGTLEVLVEETSGEIRHVLYRSGVTP
jgi:hypothetical protein